VADENTTKETITRKWIDVRLAVAEQASYQPVGLSSAGDIARR